MDTLEKQKERHSILEKRNKIRRQLFPIRVALVGVVILILVSEYNYNFAEGWFLRLLILVGVLMAISYIIEAIRGNYKRK